VPSNSWGTLSGWWNPILATTKAKTPPPTATCPARTDPNTPGPVDQPLPQFDAWNNQAAAFDRHTGRIVFVDGNSETWTFDVCTNTWQQMHPTLIPTETGHWYELFGELTGLEGELVYDVDSDRTIAFESETVAVYNAATDTWTQRAKPTEYDPALPGLGAVYDPVSGLVILQTAEAGLVAYDVDTDVWTPVGVLRCSPFMVYDPDTDEWAPAEPVEGCSTHLVGYSAETDRLSFAHGMLVDPRSGESTQMDAPPGGVSGGFGVAVYATGTEDPYVFNEGGCRLDPRTLDWGCVTLPDFGIDHGGFSARVGDPINNRLVLINGFCCARFDSDFPGETTGEVWATDLETGEWIELLARSGR